MTSIPASRRARAITLAPRSWPSKPGLATSTRMGADMKSDAARFLVRAKNLSQGVTDLAQRRVNADRIQDKRHGIHRSFGSPPEGIKGSPHPAIIALGAQSRQFFRLVLLGALAN